jgi:hypothetical protein
LAVCPDERFAWHHGLAAARIERRVLQRPAPRSPSAIVAPTGTTGRGRDDRRQQRLAHRARRGSPVFSPDRLAAGIDPQSSMLGDRSLSLISSL